MFVLELFMRDNSWWDIKLSLGFFFSNRVGWILTKRSTNNSRVSTLSYSYIFFQYFARLLCKALVLSLSMHQRLPRNMKELKKKTEELLWRESQERQKAILRFMLTWRPFLCWLCFYFFRIWGSIITSYIFSLICSRFRPRLDLLFWSQVLPTRPGSTAGRHYEISTLFADSKWHPDWKASLFFRHSCSSRLLFGSVWVGRLRSRRPWL